MSEQQNGAQKTEKPTPKRLRDARKKGQVAKTEEVPTVVKFIIMTTFLFFTSGGIIHALQWLIMETTFSVNQPLIFSLSAFWVNVKKIIFYYLIPLIAIMLVMLYFGFIMQIGFIFSIESLKPSLSKVNPIKGFKNIFSKKKLFVIIRNILRVIALFAILYYVIMYYRNDFEFLSYYSIGESFILLGKILLYTMVAITIFSLVAAIVDFAFEKRSLLKQLMMSKEDIKRDLKDVELSTEVKEKQKELFREIQGGSLQDRVKKSSVVVKNPTKIAVCLYYKMNETPLPVVIEKKQGKMAQKIVRIAEKYGIPVVVNIPVARKLFNTVGVNHFISRDLMAAVAVILNSIDTSLVNNDQENSDAGA